MGFFKNLFSGSGPTEEAPNIQFGRFSDSYKEEVKYDEWDKALELFQQHNYVAAYESFFSYLSEDTVGNVQCTKKGAKISFSFYQGSKLITGTADGQKFYAEAKIARLKSSDIGVYRKLLEDNFQLRYSRYAIDDNKNLTIVFGTYALDASPYKLYYALKELATTADKTDDILVDRYQSLESINTHHIREISLEEKTVKYEYLQTAIKEAQEVTENCDLNLAKHPGALSYIYLDLIYRIDYLLKPEGYTMDCIAKIDKLYFHENTRSLTAKNEAMGKQIRKLQKLTQNNFYQELYEVKATFGTTTPSGQKRIAEFIKGEIGNMDWYLSNGYHAYALAIPSYIVGYSLYSYSMPIPMRSLLALVYRVCEYPFFRKLGFHDKFVKPDSSLSSSNIKRAIMDIVAENKSQYDNLNPDMKAISYDSIYHFVKSFLLMVSDLDFTRKDLR